jgi:anthranilate/para-aminobenzoate synthase component II
MHGKTSMINHDNDAGVFAGLSNPFEATRYHSLIIEEGTLPEEYVVCASSADDRARLWASATATGPCFGVQFHPESFLTGEGDRLLANFLEIG